MTGRLAAVVLAAAAGGPDRGLRLALLEDTYEVLAGLELVEAGIVVTDEASEESDLLWPGDALHVVPDADVVRALDVLHAEGIDRAVVVAPDVPDLPGLLIGKLFRALGRSEVAVIPAADGTLAALASVRPAPGWLRTSGVGLDTPDAVAALRAAAPRRTSVGVAPGWHRVRDLADVRRLDPGLEGWAATRAYLARSPNP